MPFTVFDLMKSFFLTDDHDDVTIVTPSKMVWQGSSCVKKSRSLLQAGPALQQNGKGGAYGQ